MGINDVLIIFNCSSLGSILFTHIYVRPSQGPEHSLTSSTICWTAVASGTRSSGCLPKGLLLAAALCCGFVPSYHPCQSASTLLPASSPRITADKASWEAPINSCSKPHWFLPSGNLGVSARLFCWPRTGRDRDGRGQALGPIANPCYRLHFMEPWGGPSSGVLQLLETCSCQFCLTSKAPHLQTRSWLCRKIFQTLSSDKSADTPALPFGKKRCNLQCWWCYNLKGRYIFFF